MNAEKRGSGSAGSESPEHIDIEKLLVDTEKLSAVLCVTERSVNRFTKDQGMPKHGRNRFELVKCVQWYVQHLVVRGAGGDDDSITEERRLLVRSQRQKIELEIQKHRGELIDGEAVKKLLGETATIFATHLESLGSRLPATLAAMDNPVEIQKVLTNEARAIRSATSAAFIDFATTYPGLRNTRTAATKKRRVVGGRKPRPAARGARAGTVED